MGRREEERGGACCCRAGRAGRLCERGDRGEGEKMLSEADCAGKMFAAAGNLLRLRPEGGGRFFPAGGGTRWKTACRGGARKRDAFRDMLLREVRGGWLSACRGGVTAVACRRGKDVPFCPDARFAPGGAGCFDRPRGVSRKPFRRISCVRRRAAGCRAQKKAAGMPTARNDSVRQSYFTV